jgi:hypothetical protein
MQSRSTLRLTIWLGLIASLGVSFWFLGNGLLSLLRYTILRIHLDPTNMGFHPIWDGLVIPLIYTLVVWLSYRGAIRQKRWSSRIVGGLLFLLGIVHTFGPWNLIRDIVAGIHLFAGLIFWRWGKELRPKTEKWGNSINGIQSQGPIRTETDEKSTGTA